MQNINLFTKQEDLLVFLDDWQKKITEWRLKFKVL